MISKEFIEITAQYDGKKAIIRVACIEGVTDNAEQKMARLSVWQVEPFIMQVEVLMLSRVMTNFLI